MAKASTFKTAKVVKSLKSPKTPKANKLGKKAGKADDRLKTGLDPSLVGKAVEALLKYNAKQAEKAEKQVLIGNDKPVQVQFTLMRAPGHSTPKPVRVLIPHPLFKLADKDNSERSDEEDIEEPEICLIVKEESKAWCQELISKFPNHMGCVKKVLGLQSLRKKHARYEQRRELLNKYNFFMADDRILPMLSKSLGTDFFKAKKLPIPINLTRKEALPFAIQKALSATYMTVSTGTCVMVRYVTLFFIRSILPFVWLTSLFLFHIKGLATLVWLRKNWSRILSKSQKMPSQRYLSSGQIFRSYPSRPPIVLLFPFTTRPQMR